MIESQSSGEDDGLDGIASEAFSKPKQLESG